MYCMFNPKQIAHLTVKKIIDWKNNKNIWSIAALFVATAA